MPSAGKPSGVLLEGNAQVEVDDVPKVSGNQAAPGSTERVAKVPAVSPEPTRIPTCTEVLGAATP